MIPATQAERTARYRRKRRDEGQVEVDVWVPAEMVQSIRRLARILCERTEPPSERQLGFAREIAARTGASLPEIAEMNAAACQIFIAVATARKRPG